MDAGDMVFQKARIVDVERNAGILRRESFVVDGHAGIFHDLVQQIIVLIEPLLDKVALGLRAADATDNVCPDDSTNDLNGNAEN